MSDPDQTPFAHRHAGVDTDAFDRTAREHMNAAVSGPGHHPYREYSPLAWRHYVRRLALLRRMASLEFDSALDVGCAEGFFMDAIAQARGADVWGVDLSDAAVRIAAERYQRPVGAARATALPFADGAFDLVYSTEVIEHVLDPDAMLAELRRVARRYVLVTTPVSQNDHAHAPDYEINDQGHVNNFDDASIRRLFGPEADVRTFRNNATFAMLTAVGRHLPPPARDWFYELDHRVAQRAGSPHSRVVALRNRDWLIVTAAAAGDAGPREWRCPVCHGELISAPDALRCPVDDLTFRYGANAVPDFVIAAGGEPVAAG